MLRAVDSTFTVVWVTKKERDPSTVTGTIGRRVKELRGRRGWSAADLEGRCERAGAPELKRTVIANLETGRRGYVTVRELLALAYVLDVAPVHLLVPLDDDAHYSPLPLGDLPADWARAWIRGQRPLPDTDQRMYFSEVPVSELVTRKPSEEERARREDFETRQRPELERRRNDGGE